MKNKLWHGAVLFVKESKELENPGEEVLQRNVLHLNIEKAF